MTWRNLYTTPPKSIKYSNSNKRGRKTFRSANHDCDNSVMLDRSLHINWTLQSFGFARCVPNCKYDKLYPFAPTFCHLSILSTPLSFSFRENQLWRQERTMRHDKKHTHTSIVRWEFWYTTFCHWKLSLLCPGIVVFS